jgi:regulator of replication initiation timing
MNEEETDTLRLLMWIEKLEQKISKLEREIIDLKSSVKKPIRNDTSEEIKSMNMRLAALETATRQLSERSGKPIK